MEPFRVPSQLERLADPYVDAVSLLRAARDGGEQVRIGLARLWLSEGIPFAFRESPGLYESVRSWLSARLDVHAKEISVTGSGRLGSSIAPDKTGKLFGENSDLDWFVVSKSLFDRLKEDFLRWSFEYERGIVKPTNKSEERFWKDNNSRGQVLIQRGFIDSWNVPNLPDYPTIKKVSQAMWLLVEKLKLTSRAPHPKNASLRCYASWDDYVQQMCLNLQ